MKHETWVKKIGFKEVNINMGMFDYGINCAIGNHKNIDEYIRVKFDDPEWKSDDGGYEARGKCFYRSGYMPVIWIPKYPKTTREYATLAHESLHAMFHVFRWASMPVNDSTEEVMTHGMSHIINEILKSK